MDPDLREHVEIVEGEWPELTLEAGLRDDLPGAGAGPDIETGEVDVVLSRDAADRLLLEVGDEVAGAMVLAGIYEPTDPDDPRWQHVDNAAALGVIPDPDRGDTAYATAFLSPDNRGSTGQPASVQMRLWYPVVPGAITGSTDQVQQLRSQLTGFVAQQHELADSGTGPDSTGPLEKIAEEVGGARRASASCAWRAAPSPLRAASSAP